MFDWLTGLMGSGGGGGMGAGGALTGLGKLFAVPPPPNTPGGPQQGGQTPQLLDVKPTEQDALAQLVKILMGRQRPGVGSVGVGGGSTGMAIGDPSGVGGMAGTGLL